ncbi:MAG: NYN domain-containing protein [Peptococcaceae bacterium]|nr:NYN domain-containing protein [Peptococcaceae bacterium]
MGSKNKTHLLVDGYNVIFNVPDFKNTADLDHAREKLIAKLSNYAALTGQKIIIVFDAHRVPGGVAHIEEHGDVEVVFTAESETADNVIERLAGKLAREGIVQVVTADYLEQRLILGQGAYRLPPGEFWQQVCRVHARNSTRREEKPAEGYLENRLEDKIRKVLEDWRQK